MSTETDLALVRQWVAQMWNAGDLEALARFHPPPFDHHGQPARLLDARQWHLDARATFPDLHYTIDALFAAGDRVALRWTATATHQGSLWGIIPPTGQCLTWGGVHLLRVVDGQIAAVWALADTAAQLRQMGVTLQPAPAATPAAGWPAGAFWGVVVWSQFGAAEGFMPPPPFGLEELDPSGVPPPRVYSPAELLAYLDHCRARCRAILAALTPEQAARACLSPWGRLSFAELLLYNLRHVQDHAAELHLLLGQQNGSAPGWVLRARP